MESACILALDFGGTKHTAATISLERLAAFHHGDRAALGWDQHRRVFSPPGADAAYDIDTMLRLGRELLGDRPGRPGRPPAAVGVSFGGPVDFTAGLVRLSHHVPGWENTPLGQLLADAFQAPVGVDNDGNIAALGEHRFGAGQGCEHLMYITVSTGVGGGWILNGRPWRGSEGMSGEIGHTVIDPQGPVCLCGKRGCLERLASGPYMAQDARQEMETDPQAGPILRQIVGGDLQSLSGKVIAQAAAQGDPLAGRLLDRSAWALGVGIGDAANLINPQRFILGGGVTKSGERFWETIRHTARQTALPEVHFEVLPAALGDDAPLWGAVALAEELLK